VWRAVGDAFGLGEATEAMVLDRLGGLDALLLLDNCEHLIADLAVVVGRILGVAPGLRILATSQVPLGLDGEIVYDLEPLTPADSVTLFRRQATRRRRSFDADRQLIEQVCRALDGLPLAIELAAARTRSLSVQEIGRRLDDRFTLLGDPAGQRPARQRTLRAAIGWSYDLLFPDDQRGLWALAAFTGGAPLPAAEQVLGALGVPAVDVLDRLVDRSLAIADFTADGQVRYRLLDSVRAYGRERLRESGEAEVAAGAHSAWIAAAAGRAAAGLRGPAQAGHLATVRAERANIDAALSWLATHDPVLGLRTAVGFGWAWVFLGAGQDAADRMRSLLTPGAPVADRVDGLLFAGWFEASGGNVERALADIDTAGRLAQEESDGDAGPAVRVRLFRAFVRSQQGRPQDALRELAELPATGWEEGAAWLLRAWAQIALGEIGRGREACDEALRLLDDDWALGHAEALLGALAQAEHRYADAITHLTRATAAAERLGFLGTGSLHRAGLGRALQQNGDPAAAVTAFERAIGTAHAAGDLRIVALAHTRLARVLRAEGRDDEARDHVATARRWYATAGGGDGALLADHLAAALDDDADALRRVAGRHDPETEALSLDALARIAAADGRTAEAAALLAEADRLAPPHLVTDDDRIDKRRSQGLR
jgi:predicted ATPase